jgi:hypothetical protein
VDESGSDENEITEECVFGFPSEDCLDCELEGCELTCEHFESMDEEEPYKTSICKKCGQELKYVSKDCIDDEVYCITCYFEQLKKVIE